MASLRFEWRRGVARIAIFPLIAVACTANAAVDESSPSQDSWHYAATLYAYFPSLYGESQFPNGETGPTFRIDAHRVVKSLNFAFMGRLHVQKGRWGASADLFYSDVSDSLTATHDFSVSGVPVPVGVTGNFKLRAKTTLLTLTANYQLQSKPEQNVGLIFGARLDDTRQKLGWELSSSLTGPAALSGTTKISKRNLDAVVGVSGRWRFGGNLRWFVPYYADAGAGDSRFTGQAIVGVGHVYPWGDVVAAWRYIVYEYRSDSAISRLSFSGPAIGVTWRF